MQYDRLSHQQLDFLLHGEVQKWLMSGLTDAGDDSTVLHMS